MLQPGEGRPFVLSAAYFFFVLFSYYLLRPVRDTMGIRGDIDRLPWLWTCTTLATLLVAPLFAWIVSRVPRRRFVPWLYRFFALNLLAFWALITFTPAGPKNVNAGYVFFVWLSVFNLLSTSVFWGFMADAFAQAQGKRLFGPIGVGGTLGAILGGIIPATLSARIGPVNLMLVSAVTLEAVAQCVIRLCREMGPRFNTQEPALIKCPSCRYLLSGSPATDGLVRCPECGTLAPMMSRRSREPNRNVWAGFVLIARSPYLQTMVVYMLLFTMTSTFLYLEQLKVVQAQVVDEARRTTLFAWIDVVVNVLTLATQLFLTGRVLSRFGVLAGLLLLPVLTLMGFAALWRWELLGVLVGFQIVRRAMHYAVDRPTREVLYTVLGPDEKYKSKSFIDTFVYRTGDLVGAWAKALADRNAVAIGGLGVAAAGVWCLAATLLGALNRRAAMSPASASPAQAAVETAGR
jgi:AAA family ATP:ADP antiporter